MNVYLKTLGCRLNEAELESWAQGFEAKGHLLADTAACADIIVVNTCAVTQEAVKKSRQLIRRARRHNPNAKLVVSGCYASLEPSLQTQITGINLLINNQQKDRLVELVLTTFNLAAITTATIPTSASIFKRGRQRAFVKLQDGCRHRCTFCIVTIARGNERSRAPIDIINEINQLHLQGIKEVVLTGVHIGGYGNDIDCDLYRLVQMILAQTDLERLRFGSLEPWDLHADFLTLFHNQRLMPHLHLPLQSGSDLILKKMARRCRTKDYRALIQRAKKAIPNFNLTTDIIVGFPGESDEQWQTSLAFIEEIGFSHIHIFPYSKRTGTQAATLPEQIEPAIKKERSRQLHLLGKSMRRAFLASQIKKKYTVLWERRNEQQHWVGYTDNFIRVALNKTMPINLENQISTASIIGLNADGDSCLVTSDVSALAGLDVQ